MSYQRDRDEFIKIAVEEGLSLDVARKLLRYANTLHRLAVAQCNGGWPADNGERAVIFCPKCESSFVESSFRKGVCPDCRTQELVNKLRHDTRIESTNPEPSVSFSIRYLFNPVFGRDPRGAVLKIEVPSGRTNDWGREGICVPVRR